MLTNYQKVLMWSKKFGAHISEKPTFPPKHIIDLREKLIEEEYQKEYKAAVKENDLVGVADALGDILYVVYGAAIAYGIDIDEVFDEIHRSNMSKLGEDGKAIFREDGKILKGPNYTPPNIKAIIEKQQFAGL